MLFILLFDINEPWQRALVIFVALLCIPYLAWYCKYTKGLMGKTGTHPDGKPLSWQECRELMSGSTTLQCGKCGHILRNQSTKKIHTKCPECKEGIIHDVDGFID